ncbi:hypothetical protein PQ610_00690 [Tardisphaera miroshnichenkoae]
MSFKKEFLELLDKDAEFRYAIAGYLGLGDVIRKLDEHSEILKQLLESTNKLWESNNKLWEEVKALREGQDKLWQENQKIWEELKSLREGQDKLWESNNKLWESNNKLWEEVKALREGQDKLWQENQKIWEELKSLREGQDKLWESNNKLWEEVKALREGQDRLQSTTDLLSRRMNRLEVEVDSFGNAVGRTLEDYTASFVRLMLEEKEEYKGKGIEVGRKVLQIEGKQIEIDVFCEEPLVVGEVTTYVKSKDEAQAEFEKLADHVAIAEKRYNKKALMKLLSVGNAPSEAVEYLKAKCKEAGVIFVYGKELIE